MSALLGGAAHGFPLAQRLGIAWGDIGELRIESDGWRDLPGPRAFTALGELRNNRNCGHVRQPERLGWTVALDQNRARGDAQLGEVSVDSSGEQVRIGDMNDWVRLQRRTDALLRALNLQSPGDDAADIAQLAPFLRQFVIAPSRRD